MTTVTLKTSVRRAFGLKGRHGESVVNLRKRLANGVSREHKAARNGEEKE